MLLRRYSNRQNQPKLEEVVKVAEPKVETPKVEVEKPKKSRK